MTKSDDPPMSYTVRRDEIAALAAGADRPARDIVYTEAENATWRAVMDALGPAWRAHACDELLAARERLDLPADRVPQLREVSERLAGISGFEYRAVPGLVPVREFFSALAAGVFLSTQYVRWEGSPLYTPEPDAIHELVGHANSLACPDLADVHRAAGRAIARLEHERSRKFVADVFWFSVEFGVVAQDNRGQGNRDQGNRGQGDRDQGNRGQGSSGGSEWRAYGAGLLSSHGELAWFADHAEVRPLDLAAMGTLPYDIDIYQPVLFGARSLSEVVDVVGGFFDSVDDDDVAELVDLAQRAHVNG